MLTSQAGGGNAEMHADEDADPTDAEATAAEANEQGLEEAEREGMMETLVANIQQGQMDLTVGSALEGKCFPQPCMSPAFQHSETLQVVCPIH